MSEPGPTVASEGLFGTFRAEPEGITAVDDWIEGVRPQLNVDEKVIFRARLCIAEIAANLLEHSASSEPAEFTVTLRRCGSDLDVEIVDTGAPFDPTAAGGISLATSVESARVGGLGLHFIRSLASHWTYHRDGAFNHLKFHLAANSV